MVVRFLTHNQRQQVKDLAEKYDYPARELLKSVSDKLLDGTLSFEAIMIGWRMSLAQMSGKHESFTVEDMMKVTGESEETIIEAIEQMRADAIARGEDPDNYAAIIPQKRNRMADESDYIKKMIDGNEEICLSARGIVKLTYFTLADDDGSENRTTIGICNCFMDIMYKLCAMRGYGKSFSEIKAEVTEMDKDKATEWIEAVYGKYLLESDVFETLNTVKSK